MKVTALVENTTVNKDLRPKHGLSLYIETQHHKILFDLGPNALFLKNARKLGINISEVDTVVISHGHSDHGGGLRTFMKENAKAKIYVHKDAFKRTYTKAYGLMLPIGLDSSLEKDPRISLTDGQIKLDDELTLFSGTSSKDFWADSNNCLYIKDEEGRHPDDFRHEQYLIIKENGKHMLISGCAHRGIVNITEEAEKITGAKMDWCISGFHLYDPVKKNCEKEDTVKQIADRCLDKGTQFITCHCTGARGYGILKEKMGERLDYIGTGRTMEF